jgi:ankyrin repeat protein
LAAPDPSIFEAARTGNLPALRKLLSDRNQLLLRGPGQRTALHFAAEACQPEATRLLTEAGADRTALDAQSRPPLAFAERCPDPSVRATLARYLKPTPAGVAEPNALQYAVARGQSSIVSMLLTLNVDINAQDLNGDRALDIACLKGDTGIARLLLGRGADPNLRNKEGATPLHDAALKGNREIVDLLLAKGADADAVDADNAATPLHYAASFGRTDVVHALLTHGANRQLKDAKGQTPLAIADKNGYQEIVALLRD